MVFILVNNPYFNKGMEKQRIITLLIVTSTPIRIRSQGSSYSAFKSITSKNEFPCWIVIGGNRKTSCNVHVDRCISYTTLWSVAGNDQMNKDLWQ